MKLHISVGFPLKTYVELMRLSRLPTGTTSFSRYVLMVPDDQFSARLAEKIHAFVSGINAETLNLTDDERVRYAVQNDLMAYPFHLTQISLPENVRKMTVLYEYVGAFRFLEELWSNAAVMWMEKVPEQY